MSMINGVVVAIAAAGLVACSGGGGSGAGTGAGTPTTPPVATEPTPTPGGGGDHAEAQALFARKCSGCHQGDRRKAPLIEAGYNSRAWIKGFLKNPSAPEYFGKTGIDKMKPVKLAGADLDAVVEFVYSQSGAPDADRALAARGKSLFTDGSCSNCHSADGSTTGDPCPNLGGRGSTTYLEAFIADPGGSKFFGTKKNEMPAFAGKLSAAEVQKLAAWIHSLKDASPKAQ